MAGTKVYAGGIFSFIGGQTRFGLAEIDAASGAVTAWNASLNVNHVGALVVDGSTLFIGGGFTQVGGQPRLHLAERVIGARAKRRSQSFKLAIPPGHVVGRGDCRPSAAGIRR